MKLKAESTSKIVTLITETGAVEARIWEATTEGGVRCHLYVTLVAVAPEQDQNQFELELEQQREPTAEVAAIPLRLIL